MSYSVEEPCGQCAKQGKCGDFTVLRGAVDTMHQLGPNRGHLGSGSITLKCQNFEPMSDCAGPG